MIPVQLEYTAPTGCPSQAEFVAWVASRGGDFANPSPKTKARTMTVSLRREASEHSGALELTLDDLATDARQLRGQTCVEVAEALAVVAAIALRGQDAPSASAAPAAPPTALEPSAPPAAKPEPAGPTKALDTRLRSVGLWRDAEVPVTAGPLRINRNFTITLRGGAMLGPIPDLVLPRYDVTFTRTNFITTPQGNNFLIGNVFGVRWSFLGVARREDGTYSTKTWGFKAGLVSCSSLSYDTEGFVALLCGNIAMGMMKLDTTASASYYSQEKEVPFGAAAVDLDVRYNFGKHLNVGAVVGGEMWLSDMKAERADGSQLFKSRVPGAYFQLGLGVSY